jgi:hypothetical protein
MYTPCSTKKSNGINDHNHSTKKISRVSSLPINKGTKQEVRRVKLEREINEKRELYAMRNVGLS